MITENDLIKFIDGVTLAPDVRQLLIAHFKDLQAKSRAAYEARKHFESVYGSQVVVYRDEIDVIVIEPAEDDIMRLYIDSQVARDIATYLIKLADEVDNR